MLANRFSSEILEPLDLKNKINNKAKKHLIFLGLLLMFSCVFHLIATTTIVTFPTLLSVAKSSPISFDLPMNISVVDEKFTTIRSFLEKYQRYINKVIAIMIFLGAVFSIVRQSLLSFALIIFCAYSLNNLPVFIDLVSDSKVKRTSEQHEAIKFDSFVTSGDVKGYLNSVEKYSVRAGLIVNTVIENKTVNQDDAINLIDAVSPAEAKIISVGVAETIANAVQGGEQDLASTMPVVAALAAYTLSATDGTHNSVIDDRTGYAVFDAAKDLNGFEAKNIYSEAVSSQIVERTDLRSALSKISAILLSLSGVFFMLWGLSLRNAHRVKSVLIEEEKLRYKKW